MKRLQILLHLAIVVIWFGAVSTEAWANQAFRDPSTAREAVHLERSLQELLQRTQNPASVSSLTRSASLHVRDNKHREAISLLRLAIAQAPDRAELWLRLARSALAIDPSNSGERRQFNRLAMAAAYKGLALATKDRDSTTALQQLSTVYQRRQQWRAAINALKARLAIAEDGALRAQLVDLVSAHGFRINGYVVESDGPVPRVCVQFSEPLARDGRDLETFFSVDGRDPAAVALEDYRACVEGVRHGERHRITVRAGLPSSVQEDLPKSADLNVYVRDRAPSVRFSGRAYVLPSRGQQGIPVTSVNTDTVNVQILRIGDRGLSRAVVDGTLERRLSGYGVRQMEQDRAVPVWSGELAVTRVLNEDVTTAFPVTEVVGTLEPGVYAMVASVETGRDEQWRDRPTQWFIVSDLGLTALSGSDGVHGFVRSLSTSDAVSGTTVKLVARNNEVLGEAVSDATGHVRFPGGLARGDGALAPAILVAETQDGDYAFLDLTSGAFDLSDRGVGGRQAPGPLDAYIVAERGVYRPGATVHLTALLRKSDASAALGIPLTMIAIRPDGVEQERAVIGDAGAGGRTWDVAISQTAMTGTWRVRAHLDPSDPPLAETTFLVEDFVPERLDLELTADKAPVVPGGVGRVAVAGRYLYGPPAANLAIAGDVLVRPSTTGLNDYEGYRFGLEDEEIASVREVLTGLPKTDAAGRAEVSVPLPPLPRTSRLMEAVVSLQLREPGGRQIERGTVLPIAANRELVGIKPRFKAGELDRGETAEFDVIALDAAGRRTSATVEWQLVRLNRRYQWFSRDGSWAYEAVTTTTPVSDGRLRVEANEPARIAAPVEGGRYRLDVAWTQGATTASSMMFNAGWWSDGDDIDTPEFLDVALDKEKYSPGDVATLQIDAEHAGRALVTVLNDGLVSAREQQVPAGRTAIDIEVSENWGSGAYVAVQFYRAMDEASKRMPSRSIGIAWLPIDQSQRTLKVAMDTPEKVGSGARLDVGLRVEGLAENSQTYLTVAAVDVGVLNLTRYEPPKPEGHYFAQRRLGVELRDLYGRLIDGMRANAGRVRSGGDGGIAGNGAPPVEKPLALFSGVITAGPDGTADIAFPLPQFNGTVRLMAMAWNENQVGHGVHDVLVRDPMALLVTAPRVLTLGDETRLGVDLHNIEGPAGDYSVSVLADTESADATADKTITLKLQAQERRFVPVAITAEHVGPATYTVRVNGPGGIDLERRIALDVKAPAPFVRRQTRQVLAAGGSFSITSDLVGDLFAERSRVTVAAGEAANLDVPRLLTALHNYPYGCAEQTTSRALPLLYLSSVSQQLGLADAGEIRDRVSGAILRLGEMQDSSGAFGLWAPGSGDLWLTAYVTDFLTRAKEKNYEVDQSTLDQALDRLQNFISYAGDFDKGGESIAYALYVLARNGRAPIGDLRYYHDELLARFTSPLGRAHLGAALAMYGDRERSQSAFAAATELLQPATGSGRGIALRSDYGSMLRDAAATMTLVSETRSADSSTRLGLRNLVGEALSARSHTSTQENAWLLLAAHAATQSTDGVDLSIGGQIVEGALISGFDAARLDSAPIAIENRGSEPINAVITVTGAATTPEPAASNGLTISRGYYTLNGEPVNLESTNGGTADVTQNQRMVVVLSVGLEDSKGGRLLIEDRLPAGFEIENPRIVDSASVSALPWLQTTVQPEHLAFRDGRFVASLNLWPGSGQENKRAVTLAYTVRAVSPGRFLHPPAFVEDMYRPERFARTPSGTLVVKNGE